MRNVVLARVDDRLIHGQVMTGWVPILKANRLIIADDASAENKLTRRVLEASAHGSIKVSVYTVEKAAEMLLRPPKDNNERFLLLVTSPVTIRELVKRGCSFREVNLGGMGMYEDRKPFFRNLACSGEEIAAIRELDQQGIRVYYQLVPEQKKINYSDF